MADRAQNIKDQHLSGQHGPLAEVFDAAAMPATSSPYWLAAAFGKRPYVFSLCCILLLTLSGMAFAVLSSPSSSPEKLTQIRIQFDTSSVQKPDPQALMTIAQSAVLSDEGTAELARQIINDGLVLSSAPEATWWGLFWEVVIGKPTAPSDPVLRAKQDMRDRITLSQAADGSALFVTTYAETSGASVRFAQHAANRIVAYINASLPSGINDGANAKRVIFEKAEAAVTGFQVRHGAETMTKMETVARDLALVGRSADELETRLVEVTRNLSEIVALKGAKALETEIPGDAVFLPLQDAAQQYMTASKTLAQLSVQFGPKHPRVIAATQTLTEIKANAASVLRRINNELKQQEQAIKTDFAQAKSRQQVLEKEMAVFGDAPQELKKLESELTQARDAYFSDFNENDQQALNASGQFAVANAPLAVNITNDFRQKVSLAVIGGGAGFVSAIFVLVTMQYGLRKPQPAVIVEDIGHDYDPDMLAAYNDAPAVFSSDEWEDNLVEPEESFDISDDVNKHYGFAANDIPLDQRVREVLMRGSIKASTQDEAQFPPVVAAAMRGRFEVHAYDEPDEILEVRRDLAILRQRLYDYADRRAASSR